MSQDKLCVHIVFGLLGCSGGERQALLSLQASENFDEQQQNVSFKRFMIGIVAAVIVGVLNGSLMVPFHYYSNLVPDPNAAIRLV